MNKSITMKTSVVVDGRRWYMFDIKFKTPDGIFGFHIYALSHDHAADMLIDIKKSATVDGQVLGFMDGPDVFKGK
jgi:hypothetical protein